MKIFWIEPHMGCVGGIRRITELANQLVDKGHDVTILTPSGEACDWMECKFPIVKLDDYKGQECDIVLFNFEPQYNEPAKFKSKYVVYYILHYGVLYKYPEVCRASYRMPYFHIANSHWTAKNVKSETGKSTAVIIPGGINTNHFRYDSSIKKEYELLCYGSNRKWKGTISIQRAANRLDMQLKTYEGAGIPQDKMYIEYNKAKIFVSASHFEGWNNPGLEAMACGVPLVITNDGGSGEYAINGYNCLVVPPKDENALCDAIAKLRYDEELQNRLKINGLKTAEIFTWKKAGDKLEEVLLHIMDKKEMTDDDIIKFNNKGEWNIINQNVNRISVIITVDKHTTLSKAINLFTKLKNQSYNNFNMIVMPLEQNDLIMNYIANVDMNLEIANDIDIGSKVMHSNSFIVLNINDTIDNNLLLNIFNVVLERDCVMLKVIHNENKETRYLVKKEFFDKVFDTNIYNMVDKIVNGGLRE
jgi:hypothetical protein